MRAWNDVGHITVDGETVIALVKRQAECSLFCFVLKKRKLPSEIPDRSILLVPQRTGFDPTLQGCLDRFRKLMTFRKVANEVSFRFVARLDAPAHDEPIDATHAPVYEPIDDTSFAEVETRSCSAFDEPIDATHAPDAERASTGRKTTKRKPKKASRPKDNSNEEIASDTRMIT